MDRYYANIFTNEDHKWETQTANYQSNFPANASHHYYYYLVVVSQFMQTINQGSVNRFWLHRKWSPGSWHSFPAEPLNISIPVWSLLLFWSLHIICIITFYWNPNGAFLWNCMQIGDKIKACKWIIKLNEETKFNFLPYLLIWVAYQPTFLHH